MASTTFTDQQGRIEASWLNEVNDVVWGVLNGATTAAEARTALDVYDTGSVDTALALKANSADVYTEAEVDAALALKADLASPALTGNPTAPTQTAGDNSTKIATTAYADAAVTAGGNTFVNNANGAPIISVTTFQISTNITETVWESVGPTGGGADNTWTALDDVPTDADWIEVRIVHDHTETAGTAHQPQNCTIWGRAEGSLISGDSTKLGYVYSQNDASGDSQPQHVNIFKIPVNSRQIELYWSSSFNVSDSMLMYLTGYGYNV